ncbi:branched-chain amino acid ABC transporter permease [Pseudoclavibacter sp. RFBI5]|uniref:AzlC family ABC transporter permease n=1 Tax=Pseudoclavibacter sp. RFBI5 TaxID=2080578 RepID=UPI000CE814C6|nr:AzlC family ABC transporter permease [Pseudoclavibacter sp. RFBI5]PPG04164.1 branched-chain amino acid ABC transporter permease [Pseudoclavibacter sp. RFBI5]
MTTADPEARGARPPGSAAPQTDPAADPSTGALLGLPAEIPATRGERIRAGLRDSLAAGLGVVPLGVAFGVLVLQAGLPWWVAPSLSVFVYAGSIELLLVGLIAAGTPIATMALTTFFVNFRHVFYAFSFPLHLVRGRLARLYSIWAMTDEAYAIVTPIPREQRSATRLLTLQLALQTYWVGGGLLGVALASVLPGEIKGLEFSLCALFTVLALDAIRSRDDVPSLLIAGLSVSFGLLFVPGAPLFAALILFAVALAVRALFAARRDRTEAPVSDV